MKKILVSFFVLICFHQCQAQSITLASLDSVIKTMQTQIAVLQKAVAPVKAPLTVDATGNLTIATATRTPGSVGVITAEMLIDLDNKISLITTKISALKATSTTTTILQ